MFDIGWTEMLVVAVVMILVVGPKDLPAMLRTIGKTVGNVRRMASDFQRQFSDALKESELDEVRKDLAQSTSIPNPLDDINKSADELMDSLDADVDLADADEAIATDVIEADPVGTSVAKAKATAKPTTSKPISAKPSSAKPLSKNTPRKPSKPKVTRAATAKPKPPKPVARSKSTKPKSAKSKTVASAKTT